MTFLAPNIIAIVAALAVPPLIGLYFLKLKRAARIVPTTLLWKRAVEDLRVNAPFQRLRSSLLLLLQLLLLCLGALALGKPMMQATRLDEEAIILLIDQSASMGVVEADGRTRLDRAKEQAKRVVENMADDARAMVIAFSDQAGVVASFDSDRATLRSRIDSIEKTDSTSTLGEAMSLAEAFAQHLIIGGETSASDRGPDDAAPPATVFVFTDGRIQDSEQISLRKFDVSSVKVINVGERHDNVGIVSMNARRNYERPEMLEVAASVRNFADAATTVDAVLYLDGRNIDIKSVSLRGAVPGGNDPAGSAPTEPEEVVIFDEIEAAGAGIVEVVLRVNDGLPTDDRAWAVVEAPRKLKVLLVTPGDPFLERALKFVAEELVVMAGDEYEKAPDEVLLAGKRSAFDVVVLDRHSTARLPQGNYFFWSAAPQAVGVEVGPAVKDELIFNWDEAHPVLRHVGVESLYVFEWLKLGLPPEAVQLIEGERSPVLAYFTREGSQFLVSAFSLLIDGENGETLYNTFWMLKLDFVVFMHNAVRFLSSNLGSNIRTNVAPGQPVTLPAAEGVKSVVVSRPDGSSESVLVSAQRDIHYAATRRAGVYKLDPAAKGYEAFAVNLFDRVESQVRPAESLAMAGQSVKTAGETVKVNRPIWSYVLLGMIGLLLLEWVVYNKRVFV